MAFIHQTQPNQAAAIRAQNLTKSYASTRALANVSLEIYPGESVAIMGPSGSGKTTLLHALAGIITPDSGSITLGGAQPLELTALSPRQRTALRAREFGFVFQQGLLVPELTVEENVALAAMLDGVSKPEAIKGARQLLGSLGLADKVTQRIGALSGGQQQRVAIARSQITNAPITFADEPTGALDSRTAQDVMQLLHAMVPAQGKTLLVVTHDSSVAQSCSQVITLQDGAVISDTALAGSNNPAHSATAAQR